MVGVALIGSRARGDGRPDSDVDLMLVTPAARGYTADTDWVGEFGTARAVAVEEWGAVTSIRVNYASGTEVEVGVTTPQWAKTDPVDPGTARVVRDGFRILFDPARLLARLVESVSPS